MLSVCALASSSASRRPTRTIRSDAEASRRTSNRPTDLRPGDRRNRVSEGETPVVDRATHDRAPASDRGNGLQVAHIADPARGEDPSAIELHDATEKFEVRAA